MDRKRSILNEIATEVVTPGRNMLLYCDALGQVPRAFMYELSER